MQWTDEPNAGFSSGKPWLPLASDYRVRNVANQKIDPDSLLSLYRRLLRLRRAEAALSAGEYRLIDVSEQALVYERRHAEQSLVIALNFSDGPLDVPLPGEYRTVLSSAPQNRSDTPATHLRLDGYEGIILAPRTSEAMTRVEGPPKRPF